jgi:long-subunit fatty acid transport protein
MDRRIIALAGILALAPLAAQAEDISYSYVDVGYVAVNFDDFNEDADGFLLRGSIEIAEQFFLFANYADISVSDADEQDYAVGLGYAWPASDTMSVYGKLAYVRAEADFGPFSFDDDGYSVAAGVRGRVAEQFELEGSITYADFGDLGDGTEVGLGARWYFTEAFALGVEGSFGDDANSYGVGFRWQWGN